MLSRTRTLFQIHGSDGTILNHGFREREWAERHLAAGHYPEGAIIVEHSYESEPAPYERVLFASDVPEVDYPLLLAGMQRFLNMTADAGRPSDAMRSEVRSYLSLGREAYVKAQDWQPQPSYSEPNL